MGSAWVPMRATTEQSGAVTSPVRASADPACTAAATTATHNPSAPCAGDSERLLTASADQTVRIWQLRTGKELFQFKHGEPCRSIHLSIGERMFVVSTDAFMEKAPMIHIVRLEEDMADQCSDPVLNFSAPKGRITRVFWSDMNRVLISSHDGGWMRKWDSEVGGGCLE